MDSLLTPVDLNRETTQALDEIRSGTENALYGADSAQAEEKIYRSVLPLIEGAGLPSVHVIHYRWFLREVARHWRSRKDRDLAFHLELCIRKWVNLGLEPRTLQFLICEAHQRLKGKFEGQSPNDECRKEPVESVDARSLQTAKAAKACPERTAPQDEISRQARNDEAARGVERDAKGPDSDTRILESSSPGILPDDSSAPGVLR